MIYLIAQDWINTTNNHAGMKYLCNKLSELEPEKYCSIIIPDYIGMSKSHNKIINKINFRIAKLKHRINELKIFTAIRKRIHGNNTIILMEYIDSTYPMDKFARKIKDRFSGINLFAIVHLTPDKLNKILTSKEIIAKWITPIDKIFTLGSSLTKYLVDKGVPQNRIKTLFHYVDEYYYKKTPIITNKRPIVIAMGNQVRNIPLLKEIILENPDIDFMICQGLQNFNKIFINIHNAKLIPFVEENELRHYMEKCDISINVMQDTIGSNVIVTSLAMGLAMICSNVGSIHDYCDDSNTIFCNLKEDYNNALRDLTNNPIKLQKMRISAYNKSKEFTINKFSKALQENINY